jgi:hypothetical protein
MPRGTPKPYLVRIILAVELSEKESHRTTLRDAIHLRRMRRNTAFVAFDISAGHERVAAQRPLAQPSTAAFLRCSGSSRNPCPCLPLRQTCLMRRLQMLLKRIDSDSTIGLKRQKRCGNAVHCSPGLHNAEECDRCSWLANHAAFSTNI